jgi:pyruvate dehydrogenase E1 component alpha subunit
LRQQWSRKDPILQLQKYMVEREWASESNFKKMRGEILAEIDEAVEWALAQPFPDPATVTDNVYESS